MALVAGLVLFLYAISNISELLQRLGGKQTEKWLLRFTHNTFLAILTGTIVTILLDSSSAVIIITIILVNSRLMTFRQAMGIVLGANIGTTISSQIIAADVTKFSPILLLCGFILLMVAKSERLNHIGKLIMYFGVVFFGLFTMENAVEPLREMPYFKDWIKTIESPIQGAFVGALVTLVLQSSSATVGMAIILAKKGLMTLTAGVAIMLGAELGTCSDTLLATIRGSRAALKTGLFHLMFNLISIIIGLILFYPFLQLVQSMDATSIEHSIANAHLLFNVAGVVSLVWFLPFFEKLLNGWLGEENA